MAPRAAATRNFAKAANSRRRAKITTKDRNSPVMRRFAAAC
jgi:hypothetical protein